MKIGYALLAAVVFVAACQTTSTYVPPNVPSSIPAAQVRVGDYWEYTVHDGYTRLPRGTYRFQVSRVDPQGVTVDVLHDGGQVDTLVYAPGWNGRELPLTNLQRFRYEPPYPAHAYPLEPGKRWNSVVNATDPVTGRTYRVHVQGRVLGWERIKVPAGEFDALKVQRYVFAGNMQSFRTQEEIFETDWYAPAVRRAVRTESSSQHYDTSRGGGGGEGGGEYPLLVRGDWLVGQLTAFSVH
jgi:hypothetical protein